MFAKLKKKIADEVATAPRPGGLVRMPRSGSKESVTSAGGESGDDFPSDGSSSREDLSSQLYRRNEQIRKLEVKLSDYAEQVRNLQKIKEKLENALETHQDSFVKKLQEQNETHQASLGKMTEEMNLSLEKKDQERRLLSAQLQEMREQSLNLFQKRDEIDELEGFQQQELAKIKHMLLKKEESLAQMEEELRSSTQELLQTRDELQAAQDLSSRLAREVQELQQQQGDLAMERWEMVLVSKRIGWGAERAELEASEFGLWLKVSLPMAVQVEEKTQLVDQLQEKVAVLEKRLEGSLSGDEHFQELFREVSIGTAGRGVMTDFFFPSSGQLADLTLSLQQKEQQIAAKTESLLKREEEAKSLRQGETICQHQCREHFFFLAAVLELASMALEDPLHLSEDGELEANGELVSSDAVQLQKENQDLEQQIVEKNKMIKQLQQRMAELKKTLQKELKIRPDGDLPEVPTAGLTVTNNSDLSDSREINFEYLKHVVLKFMSCRESEALHLIKALSVLLNFSPEEENMVKETLEYKMSWFGSKPLPRGSVRPSVSNPKMMWS
uniref:Golgin subfamily A member 1 n=1 Tax=Naja naja TaxID=35670 RepID=A0A8C6X4H6_NAJNA